MGTSGECDEVGGGSTELLTAGGGAGTEGHVVGGACASKTGAVTEQEEVDEAERGKERWADVSD